MSEQNVRGGSFQTVIRRRLGKTEGCHHDSGVVNEAVNRGISVDPSGEVAN